MAYEAAASGAVGREATGLPAEARALLAGALRELAEDPWTGQPYDPRWSPEFRTVAFGDGGLIAYIVSERRRLVVVEQVIWVALTHGRLRSTRVRVRIGSLVTSVDARSVGAFVAHTLLPNVLRYTPGTTALWDPRHGIRNGKGLFEESSDSFTRMIVNEDFSTGLTQTGPILEYFPYLSEPPAN